MRLPALISILPPWVRCRQLTTLAVPVVVALTAFSSTIDANQQSSSVVPRKATNSEPKLFVDTDDTCRLTLDGDDRGVITPDNPATFTISVGDHVLKCVIEGLPDLAWRKVVTANDSSQVAALVSLKALHIQYDETVAKAKSQKDAADSRAAQQLDEAKRVEAQRQAAAAALPQQLANLLAGTWKWTMDSALNFGPSKLYEYFAFGPVSNGAIPLTWRLPNNAEVVAWAIPVSPNQLISDQGFICWRIQVLTKEDKKNVKLDPGVVPDAQGMAACPSDRKKPGPRVIIDILSANQLRVTQESSGEPPMILTR